MIIVHGGAGRYTETEMREHLQGCRDAALAARAVLRQGGAALDAAEAAVTVMEDHPALNAGTGACLNREGRIELDASLMDGATLRAGAVAAVRNLRNPIRLARHVLEDGRHVLLVGEGANRYARTAGFPECAEAELIVPRALRHWEQHHGTVGAVVRDAHGRLAAATSTGGRTGKLPGRVGDSALIGCGTYADTAGAVSCTGEGEAIIRVVLAKTATDWLAAGLPAAAAAVRAVHLLAEKTGGVGGLIVIDRHGGVGHAHNTPHMPVCFIADPSATPVTSI